MVTIAALQNNRIAFQAHMKIHESYPGFMCHHCGFRSDDKASYKEHIEQHNSKPSLFVCVFCDKTYIGARSLRRHCKQHVCKYFPL